MVRFLLCLLVLCVGLVFGAEASAQCANGVCQLPQRTSRVLSGYPVYLPPQVSANVRSCPGGVCQPGATRQYSYAPRRAYRYSYSPAVREYRWAPGYGGPVVIYQGW